MCWHRKKSEDKALGWRRTGDTAELVEANNQYVPKTQWAIIDGLEAVKWAYTWAAYGPDEVAGMLFAHLSSLLDSDLTNLTVSARYTKPLLGSLPFFSGVVPLLTLLSVTCHPVPCG